MKIIFHFKFVISHFCYCQFSVNANCVGMSEYRQQITGRFRFRWKMIDDKSKMENVLASN